MAGDRASLRVDARVLAVCAVLAAATAVASVVAMTTGDYPLPVRDVLATLAGGGPPGADYIVTTLRLPRVVTGMLVGAALAVSGAILQSITRNPLGSPDFVGLTAGSATGALLVIIVLDGGLTTISLGALLGGLASAAVIYGLAFRRGGFRLVLVGIGVSAMLLALNQYLISRAALYSALEAQTWLTGSLNLRLWQHVWPLAVTLAVLLPLALLWQRRLALLELGDETAAALGIPVESTRLALVAISVTLAAVATAATGPIAFVALAAPQISRRLTGSPAPGLTAAALTGALLLVGSDLLVQRIFPDRQLPVGIVTGAIGGLYLAYLLTSHWRRGRP
ncbi:MAG TPA: iron chelate uptake ABC transporter family permease subunit [Pseudonocardiaceae bacterium]